MDVEIAVLSKIKPSNEVQDKVLSIANAFLKDLKSKIKDAQLILGGSIAKGTWLCDDKLDVDIFVAFDYDLYKWLFLSNFEKVLKLKNLLIAFECEVFWHYSIGINMFRM